MSATDRTALLHFRDQDEECTGPEYSASADSSPLLLPGHKRREGGVFGFFFGTEGPLRSLLRLLRQCLILIVVLVGVSTLSAVFVISLCVMFFILPFLYSTSGSELTGHQCLGKYIRTALQHGQGRIRLSQANVSTLGPVCAVFLVGTRFQNLSRCPARVHSDLCSNAVEAWGQVSNHNQNTDIL